MSKAQKRTINQNFNVAANLKYLRKERYLSLLNITSFTGIPKGTLSNYESFGSISDERLKILCDFYKVDIDLIILEPEVFKKVYRKEERG